jgi:competence protein ComEA
MIRLPGGSEGQKEAAIWAALLGLVLMGAGVFIWKAGTEPEVEIIRTVDEVNLAAESRRLVVDIEGAVRSPGVYRLSEGSRVGEAITAAGGLTETADREWIELHINLAEKVVDGYKLYLPESGESGKTVNAGKETGGLISINFASQSELESLPGIGEVTAGKIIQGRPYSKISDLADEGIVTQKVWEEIKVRISL